MNDLKYAFRTLVKSPAFTLVAILTLALGIGASTAIFSVLDAVLLRPLPYPNQERIVELRETAADGHGMSFAEPNFHDLVVRTRSFEAIAAYTAGPETVAGASEPVRTNICAVSADFFRVLGITPILGRTFTPEMVRENKEIAIVSFGFWKRLLGERSSLEGTTLRIDNRTFTVIGVLPSETEFPPNIDVWFPVDVFPANMSRTAHNWRVAARLKPDVSAAQARDEVRAIGRQLKAENGQRIDLVSISLAPLRERFVKDIRSVLVVIAAAVGFLFLIAGSNVANLLLVRAAGRRQEIAVRTALGASRWRLARQFLVETMLLTFIGGALGIVLAFWGIDLILGAYHGNLPRVGRIGINLTALIFTVGISVLAGIILGLIPGFSSSRRELQADLQSAGRGKSTGRQALRFRNSLVVAQLALTLMLLIGAGLLGRSFARLLEVNPGFEPESAVAMTVSLPYSPEPAALRSIAQFHHQLMERLLTLPGVTAVGGVSALPMTQMGANGTFIIEDRPNTAETMSALSERLTALANSGKTGDADYRCASAGYFAALGIPLVRGRTFLESDGPDSPHAAIINETMAQRPGPEAMRSAGA